MVIGIDHIKSWYYLKDYNGIALSVSALSYTISMLEGEVITNSIRVT
jgi:hypothetical protein